MKNFVKPAKIVSILAAGAAYVSGQGLLLGSLFGFVCADIASGADGEMAIHGQFSTAKATGAGTGSATQFGKAYWDNTAKLVTGVATSNTLIGVFAAITLDADTTCEVILLP